MRSAHGRNGRDEIVWGTRRERTLDLGRGWEGGAEVPPGATTPLTGRPASAPQRVRRRRPIDRLAQRAAMPGSRDVLRCPASPTAAHGVAVDLVVSGSWERRNCHCLTRITPIPRIDPAALMAGVSAHTTSVLLGKRPREPSGFPRSFSSKKRDCPAQDARDQCHRFESA